MKIPFAPPPGIVSDDTSFAAEGRWETCSNIRFWNGKPQVIGGWDERGIFLSGVPRKIYEWNANAGTGYVAYATSSPSRLYVETGGTAYNVTPVGFSVTGACSLAKYGDTLLISPQGGGLFQWNNNTAVVAAAVAGAPAAMTCMLVTPERQVLALGCNEEVSGTFNGLCIRGSDIEDPTDWITTSSNNAFENILEGNGLIVAARLIAGYVAVWTTTGLYLGQFIGDPGETYRFDLVASNCGIIGADAVVVVEGTAYWVGRDYQFYSWSPGSLPTVIPCPIQKFFQGAINTNKNTAGRTHAAYIAKFHEVWFFYPTGTSSSANPASHVGFSLLDGSWFRGRMGNGRCAFVQGLTAVIGAGTDGANGSIYNHETGSTGVATAGEDLNWSITSADQYLDSAERNLMMRGVWPDFEDQAGNVSLTVNVRQYPSATAVAKGPYTLATTTTKKDFRCSGRIFTIRFSGDDATGTTNSYMRLGKPIFDAVPTGER